MVSRRTLAIGGGVAAVALLALGVGLVNADFGRAPVAEAEDASSCPDSTVTLVAPSTMPVNSSAVISATALALHCQYPDGALLTIAFGDTDEPSSTQVIDTGSGNGGGGQATSYATLQGSAYAVGDTVTVSGVLEANGFLPPTVTQTQTVTVVAAETSDAQVSVEVPSTTVYAGQSYQLSGTATNINPAMYPNGINLLILVDGSVVGQTSILGQASGTVTATVRGSEAGSHTASVELTTETGAPAAQAQKTFTVTPNPASTATLSFKEGQAPKGSGQIGIVGTAVGVDPAQYPQGAVLSMTFASAGNTVGTTTIGSPAAQTEYEVTANVDMTEGVEYPVTVTLTDPSGMTASAQYDTSFEVTSEGTVVSR